MVQPTPPESRDERRRRLLSATRRAESSIDEALINYGEGEQARNRERVNQEIEKFLPGVTEDEQSPIGKYMPSSEHTPSGFVENYWGNPTLTHHPMRRTLTQDYPDINEGFDPSHPDYIKPWTDEEEEEWQQTSNRMSVFRQQGTGSGTYPTTHEIIDISPDVHDSTDDGRFQLFAGSSVPHISDSINAPLSIDKQNVRQWAVKHRKEVKETGIQDTEWKQRFEKLKQDVDETIFPVTDNQGAAVARGNNTLKHHKSILNDIWNRHSVEQPTYLTQSNTGSQSRGRRGPGRQVVTLPEVANRFAEGQTGRTSGRNFRVEEGGGGYTGRLDTGISEPPSNTDTHTVYSYATPIAWRRQSGEVVMPTQRFSSTTNRHQSELRRALENQGYHSPQRIANQMLYTAYSQDALRPSAGRAIGRRHYETGHDAEVYYPDAERAHEEARSIADTHYERINAMRQQRAASATARRSGSRTQRREQAGQLRLPTEGDNA